MSFFNVIKYIIVKYNTLLDIKFINIVELLINSFETCGGIIFFPIIYLFPLLI